MNINQISTLFLIKQSGSGNVGPELEQTQGEPGKWKP